MQLLEEEKSTQQQMEESLLEVEKVVMEIQL